MATFVWAHRGASGYAPENTLEAFEKAVEMGADGIELDVHMTKDGKVVVIHDEKVDRTSNGTGFVKDFTCQELKTLDFSCGMEGFKNVRIPTLKEVLGLLRGTNLKLNIEIKCDRVIYPTICEELHKIVGQMGMEDRVIYSSFNHYMLAKMREINPEAKIGLLYDCAIINPWEYATRIKAEAIHPHYLIPLYVRDTVEMCHENGVAVNVWTPNDADTIQMLADIGVDAVITNYPDVARSVIG